jgi:hypothetical protein
VFDLPTEILLMIAAQVSSHYGLSSLATACHRLYEALFPFMMRKAANLSPLVAFFHFTFYNQSIFWDEMGSEALLSSKGIRGATEYIFPYFGMCVSVVIFRAITF